MGVLSGALSYVRFRVEGSAPSNIATSLEEAISLRRFVALHPDGEDMESHGWVAPQAPFADSEPITCEQFLFSDKVWLAYREDSINLPRAMMKDLVKAKLNALSSGSNDAPGFSVKKAAHLAVVSELRRKTLPKSKVVEFFWDTSNSTLRFCARGKSTIERFSEFFQQTFGLALVPLSFAQMACGAQLSLGEQSKLESLQPQEIFYMKRRVEIH